MNGEPNRYTDTPQVLLEHHLKQLRLPTFLREYDKVARQCAAESVDYPRYLLRLTEQELLDRERRATERRIQQARFPVVKSLDTFEFLAIPAVNKALVLELARCEFLLRRENVLLLGNSGTGKTHLALALGLSACQRGHRVRFTTAAAMVHELMEAKDEKRLLRYQKQMASYGSSRSLRTAFNPHRDALAAHCKSPYRQCSAHLHRYRHRPACGALSIRHYGFIDSYLTVAAE